jgi:hypothetical protein
MNMNASAKPHQDPAAREAATTEATDVTPKTNWKKFGIAGLGAVAVAGLATAGWYAYKHFIGGTTTVEVPTPGFFK